MKAGDIIKFSGHSSVESLVTYLDDGALDPAIIAGLTGGNVLFGGALSPGGPYPPTTDDIIQAFPSLQEKQMAPLHLKQVPHMDLDKLLELESEGQEALTYLKEALRWVRDPNIFATLIEDAGLRHSMRIGYRRSPMI